MPQAWVLNLMFIMRFSAGLKVVFWVKDKSHLNSNFSATFSPTLNMTFSAAVL